MAQNKPNKQESSPEKKENTHVERNTRLEDLQDSPRDAERLQSDEADIDLPDVKDIPGQEFIHVPRLGEMADTTISSDDEEGVGLFDDDQAEDIGTYPNDDTSKENDNNDEEKNR